MFEMLRRPEFVRMLLPMNGGGSRDGRTNEDMVKRLKRKAAITECVPQLVCWRHGLVSMPWRVVLAWLRFEPRWPV